MITYNFTVQDKTYPCKLTMKSLVSLEKKMGVGIYNWLQSMSNAQQINMPFISDVLLIFSEAIKSQNTSMSDADIDELINNYINEKPEERSLMNFLEIDMEILRVSGIIPKEKTNSKN